MSTVTDSQEPQTIYEDLSKYSTHDQTPVSSDRTSWAQRKFPLVFVGVGLLLLIVHGGLSCSNKALGELLFAFEWRNSEQDPVIMRLGSFTRQRCEGDVCVVSFLPAESFGGLPRTALFSFWIAARIIVILLAIGEFLFVALVPHPRHEEQELRYRRYLRISLVLFIPPIPISYSLLSSIMNQQPGLKIGIASIVSESLTIVLVVVGVWAASRLGMDPFYVDMLEQKRYYDQQAKMQQSAEAAHMKERKKMAKTMIAQERKKQQAVKNLVNGDKEVQRMLRAQALKKLMSGEGSAAPSGMGSAVPLMQHPGYMQQQQGYAFTPQYTSMPSAAYGSPQRQQFASPMYM